MTNDVHEAPDHRSPSEPGESRQETTARALEEVERSDAAEPGAGDLTDPSVQRGVPRGMAKALLVWGSVGAAAGVVVAVIIMLAAPGILDIDGVIQGVAYIALIAAAFAAIVGLIGVFVVLEREDGRIEREVEEATGRSSEQQTPGRPLDPAHDDEA